MAKIGSAHDVDMRILRRADCQRCGNTFDVHGAEPPHTRGEECAGFLAPVGIRPLIAAYDAARTAKKARRE